VYQSFNHDFFQEPHPGVLEQTAPGSVAYANGTDFLAMSYSGNGM
jgi:hypothetical protein